MKKASDMTQEELSQTIREAAAHTSRLSRRRREILEEDKRIGAELNGASRRLSNLTREDLMRQHVLPRKVTK